jgi:hypothetical protein
MSTEIHYSYRGTKLFFASLLQLILFMSPAFAKDNSCLQRPTESFAQRHSQAFIATNQVKYSMSQSITLYAGIRNNNSDDPIYVYKEMAWGFGGGLVLHIWDAQHRVVNPRFRDDTMLPPPSGLDNKSMFIELRADEIYGVSRTLSLGDLVRSSGRYSIQVEYRSPLACSFVDASIRELPALWHEDKSMFSNIIVIEVGP